jgi:ligand-binding sensor domain-containing protein
MTRKPGLLLFILVHSLLHAQQPLYRNIGISEGMPSTEVYCMIQDHYGYMWFSTDAGVCRFNGSSFEYFTTQNGLSDNTVFRLLEDGKGRIWMAGYNGSICVYDNGEISRVPASAQLEKELMRGNFLILSMQFDDADTLWIGTTLDIFKIPPTGNYSTLITDHSINDSIDFAVKFISRNKPLNSDISANSGRPVFKDHKLNFCVNSSAGEIFTLSAEKFMSVFFSVVSPGGTLFCSCNNMVFHKTANGSLDIKKFSQRVIFLGSDKKGDLLVGLAKGGLYRYPNCDLGQRPDHFFNDLSVSSCLSDFEGGLWTTTLEKGVYYSPFDNYIYYYSEPGLCEKITGLQTVRDGKNSYLLAANYKNEFFKVNADSSSLFAFIPEQGAAAHYSMHLYDHKLFFSGNCMGEMNLSTGKIDYYKLGDVILAGFDIAEIGPGKYTCLVYGSYAEIENGVVHKLFRTPTRGTCMLNDKNGKIWVGTLSGLYYLQGNNLIPVADTSLSKERITFITQDALGKLFVTTKNRGLFIGDGEQWENMDAASGLASNVCNYVLCDSDGTVWVATSKGISYFNYNDKKEITTLDITNGLPSNETSALARQGQYLFAGTRNGLCRIGLNSDFINLYAAPFIYLDKLIINDSTELKDRHLSYDQNNLSFTINCVTYKGMFGQKFIYRLSGQDSMFRSSTSSFVEFQNLGAGSYNFIAYAVNNAGIKSKEPVTFAFTIFKPWWRTWWFIGMTILGSIALVALAVRLSIKRAASRREEKIETQRLIAEYQLSAVRAQMNPHFIFNAINSIQNFILSNETQPAYDYLAKFGKLIRQVLINSQEQTTSLQKEIELLTIYMELEQQRFGNKFDFSIRIEKDLRTDEIMVPVLLVQPYVENSIWHGIMNLEQERKGELQLDFRMQGIELKITVQDNGVGRSFSSGSPKNTGHHSMGMMLSEKRLDALNAMQEEENRVEVTDLKDESGRPLGTKVELYLTVAL